ncbi:YopX family protein [Bacillus halotolerans]|uniref:YopX family protein n=1 Tax=Bacillus halotolerans TaxID=260554 RepID=UPI002DBB2981|nr:YopX family protein [Bacillus halotolerans]MEC1662989.1 YopX family protein [Bacillus halotolerans]
MNTAYRVWDGERMHYWDDEGMRLVIEHDGRWFLWRDGMECIAFSNDGESSLMWGTGQKDENGKMIYPGDGVEFEERNLAQAFGGCDGPDFIRKKRIIFIAKGRHNVPEGFIKNLKVVGNAYETPKLLEGAE